MGKLFKPRSQQGDIMKLLHVLRSEPNDEVRKLMRILSDETEPAKFELYKKAVNYEKLIDLVFEHDRVVTWW